MKKKYIIIVIIIIVLICIPFIFSIRNYTLISLRYNDELRILDITAGNSISYLTGVITTQDDDTLELTVYHKIMYFALCKSEQTATRLLYVPKGVNYIKYGDRIYTIEELPPIHPR